jgi:branched-chain amino acid transport system substrate-binding protein
VTLLIAILLSFALAPAWAQQPAIVVGAALSQTGALAPLARDYGRALVLWQEEVNAGGGLLGRRVELELRDDRSDARRSGELYAELIAAKADLLIGPYGSAATLMASAEAERARRVLINGAGASAAVHKRSPRWLFQTTHPYSAYGIGALELAQSAGLERLMILARNDLVSGEMGEAPRERAAKQGFAAVEFGTYDGGDVDFLPQITRARATGVEAWIAFGEVRDAAQMILSFRKAGYAPRLFFASGAADPKLIPLVGQDAEFSLGIREYDPKWTTPGNERFAAAFAARWSAPPTYPAAQGYAAATVLAEAVRRTAGLDQEKLREALAQMETETVLGGYKVDPQTGEQRWATPAVVQIQRGRPAVVWPQWLQSAVLEPYPQWDERRLLE